MLSLTKLNSQPFYSLPDMESKVVLGYTMAEQDACLLFFLSYLDVAKLANLPTNPITTFATMLVLCICQWLPCKYKLNICLC